MIKTIEQRRLIEANYSDSSLEMEIPTGYLWDRLDVTIFGEAEINGIRIRLPKSNLKLFEIPNFGLDQIFARSRNRVSIENIRLRYIMLKFKSPLDTRDYVPGDFRVGLGIANFDQRHAPSYLSLLWHEKGKAK